MDDLAAEMAILDSPSNTEASSESADVSESTAQVETQTEGVPQEETLSPEQEKPGTTTQPKPQGDKATHTPEQQQQETLTAKAAELDRADAAFADGDVAGIIDTLESMFGSNPDALTNAMWAASRFMEQRSPEQYSQFSKMILADTLGQLGVSWESLVKIAGYLQQANDRESFESLNKIAVMFKGVGHGPITPESSSAGVQGYVKSVGAMLDRSMPVLVRNAIGEKFSMLPEYTQREVLEAVRLDVRDALLNDRKLTAAYKKLGEHYTDREALRIQVEVLMPKLRTLGPLIARSVANQNSGIFEEIKTKPQPARPAQPVKAAPPAQQAPRSMAEARARNMTMADILKAAEGEISSGSFLDQSEADGMSDMDILNSTRVPLAKKPGRPEDIWDKL